MNFSDLKYAIEVEKTRSISQAAENLFIEQPNLSRALRDFGIDEAEFNAKVEKIAELAVGDACTGSNPRQITPDVIAKLFDCIYYGKEINF